MKDRLTWGEEIELPVDLVVLSVGMMPSPVQDLIEMLKIAPGNDRFLLEVHPKLRPVETAVAGVVLAGTAQGTDEHPGKLRRRRSRGLQSGRAALPGRSGTGAVRRPGRPGSDAGARANVHVSARRKAPFIWRLSAGMGALFSKPWLLRPTATVAACASVPVPIGRLMFRAGGWMSSKRWWKPLRRRHRLWRAPYEGEE